MRTRSAIAAMLALLALALGATSASGTTSSTGGGAACAAAAASAQQAVRHAGLMVVFGDERVETFCIEFVEDEISGAELLRRSGLPVVVTGFGGLGTGVCRIDDVGCSDPGNCFCHCSGAGCSYWAYYAFEDGAWEYLPVGPSQRRLGDGDADAWVWGSGRRRPATDGGPCPDAPSSATPIQQPSSQGGVPASTATPVASGNGGGNVPPEATAVAMAATAMPSAARTTPKVSRSANEARSEGRDALERGNGGSSGPPDGLLSFAAVAAVATAAIGGLVLWRRSRG